KRDDATSPPPKSRNRTGQSTTKATAHAGRPAVGVKLLSKKTQSPMPMASPAAAATTSPISSSVDRSLWRSDIRARASGFGDAAVGACAIGPPTDRCADTAPPLYPTGKGRSVPRSPPYRLFGRRAGDMERPEPPLQAARVSSRWDWG